MSGKTVVETVEQMRSIGAALKAESYADDEGNDIVAVVYADGRDAAERLLAAFALLESAQSSDRGEGG